MIDIKGALLNLYSWGEDKWYAFLEKIDRWVPVLKVTDRIDGVFPSFILFLVFVFVLAAVLLFGLFGAGIFEDIFEGAGGSAFYEGEITVTSAAGKPLEGVQIRLFYSCGSAPASGAGTAEGMGVTDAEGKLSFKTCTDSFKITASKKGYDSVTVDIGLDDKKKARISLSPAGLAQKNFFAKVVDAQNKAILGAKIDVRCLDDGNTFRLEDQAAAGFTFALFDKCASVQISASAAGYEPKTHVVAAFEERANIVLAKAQSKGKAIFYTLNAGGGKERNATIIATNNETMAHETIYSDSFGTAMAEMDAGSYSYIATSIIGDVNEGAFSIGVSETKEIEITFKNDSSNPGNDPNNPNNPNSSSLKYVKIKTVDGANPLSGASVAVYKDGNLAATKVTDSTGVMNPPHVINTETLSAGASFIASIKKAGYERKIVRAELKGRNDSPQIVELRQGGGSLKIKVIDDEGKPVKEARVSVFIEGLNSPLELLTTDINGSALLANLPAANYAVRATAQSSEGQASAALGQDETKEVTIRLVLREGTIKFKLLNQLGSAANANIEVYAKGGGESSFRAIYSGKTQGGYYTTAKLFFETEVMMAVVDANYMHMETPVYVINAAQQEKEIFIRKESELPNQNPVQMVLNRAYKSDPLLGSASEADRIEAGKDYYLYFDLVLNGIKEGDAAANFYVGPEDRNELLAGNHFRIKSARSIEGYYSLMAWKMKGFYIDPVDTNSIVGANAKQANVIEGKRAGPMTIPIIVGISVDGNAYGKNKVLWSARHGAEKSLDYSMEFTIGEQFCECMLSNNYKACSKACPVFLFTNYVKWGDRNYAAVGSDPFRVVIGDSYKLKVAVKNLGDEAIGAASLFLEVKKGDFDALSFEGDANSQTRALTIAPLSSTESEDASLVAKSPSNSAKIYETLVKKSGAVNTLANYSGNSNHYFLLNVTAKDQIELILAPNRIEEKTSYGFFVVKTWYADGRALIPAHWKAEKVLGDGSTQLLAEGNTDQNGIQVTELDATNVNKGDKVVFTAWDDQGAIPARLELIAASRQSLPEALKMDCLVPKMGGKDIAEIQYPVLNVGEGSSATFTIDSNCDSNRVVFLDTEQRVSEKQFTLLAKEKKTITVTGYAKDGIIGAYPLAIIGLDGTKRTEVGLIDVVVGDDSCFAASKNIFDFRDKDEDGGYIENKCFSGRKDSYYPQMAISTNSVGLEYDKPGTPEIVYITPEVVGDAVEAATVCYAWAEGFSQQNISETCKAPGPATKTAFAPAKMKYSEQEAALCQQMINYVKSVAPVPKPEEPVDLGDVAQPVQEGDEGGGESVEAKGTDQATTASKAKRASFASIDDYTCRTIKDDKTCRDEGSCQWGVPSNALIQCYRAGNDANAHLIDPNSTCGMYNFPDFAGTACYDQACAPSVACESDCKPMNQEPGGVPNKDDIHKCDSFTANPEVMLNANYVTTTEQYSNCLGDHKMTWISAPKPPGWGPCQIEDCWIGGIAYEFDKLLVTEREYCDKAKIDYFGAAKDTSLLEQNVCYTPGAKCTGVNFNGVSLDANAFATANGITTVDTPSTLSSALKDEWFLRLFTKKGVYMKGSDTGACTVRAQNEVVRAITFLQDDSTRITMPEVGILPIEGKIYDLGSYAAAEPLPKWTTLTTESVFGGTNSFVKGSALITPIAVQTYGIVPMEIGKVDKVTYHVVGGVMDEGQGTLAAAAAELGFKAGEEAPGTAMLNAAPKAPSPGNGASFAGETAGTDSGGVWGSSGGGSAVPDYVITHDIDAILPGDKTGPHDFNPPPARLPQFEYDSTGTKLFTLWNILEEEDPAGIVDSIPDGVEMFLYQGHVYAKYVGKPEAGSPKINFNLTKRNVLGNEYAIITVRDWTGSETTEKQIRVKLMGPPSNCYSPDGKPGMNGKEFSPRLLFNWDWKAIKSNQCDLNNPNYTYCDAAQFSVEVFQKLAEIQDLLEKGKLNLIPAKTAFYALLIKDNYSPEFLSDFDEYYSNAFSNAPIYFNTADTKKGYDLFISENRLRFAVKQGADTGTALPFGGLYKVDMHINFQNENYYSLLDRNSPNAEISIVLTPIQKAPNYNPFYETPFDGGIGSKDGVVNRENYGASISGGELLLNPSTKAMSYGNSVTSTAFSTDTSMDTLAGNVLLSYKNSPKSIKISPAQPTPVVMNITSSGGNVQAQYKILGAGAENAPSQSWKMISSTMGDAGCEDFAGQMKAVFKEASSGNTKTLSWEGENQGTMGLSTVFFTPKVTAPDTPKIITPSNDNVVKFLSKPNLINASSVMLNNYDAQMVQDYDSLEGMFKMLEDKKICMSQNSEQELELWWSQEYLKNLVSEVEGAEFNCE